MDNEKNIDEKFDDLQEILYSSKEFDFKNSTVLRVRQYYGNKEIYLDLSKIDKEMLENLYVDEKDLYKEDYDL